jgi:signal transduction histidine kinase
LKKEDETVLRQQAAHSIDRILSLIGDLSKYNTLTPVLFETVDIRSLLEKELLQVRSQCLRNQIQCRLEGPALPPVRLDASVFRHAISNVLQNAVESMLQGGRLDITVTRNDGRAAISFADTGCGIQPDMLPRVFDPMVTTKHSGTGLGLAIAQKIVEDHGGTIELESAQGRGTVVTMDLPLEPEGMIAHEGVKEPK